MRNSGFVLMHRQVFDNPVFTNHGEALAFLYLVARAAYAPHCIRYKGKHVSLQRGQVAMSVRDLAAAMDRSQGWAQRFLERLVDAKMVARNRDSTDTPSDTGSETVRDTAGPVLTICNYDKFQVPVASADTAGEPLFDTPDDGQPIHNKNKENERIKRKETPYSPPSKKRATAWSGGDKLPTEWLQWAKQDRGWTSRQTLDEAQRFIDSALARGRTYIDWQAAWRQWCRSSFQKTVGAQQQPLSL